MSVPIEVQVLFQTELLDNQLFMGMAGVIMIGAIVLAKREL